MRPFRPWTPANLAVLVLIIGLGSACRAPGPAVVYIDLDRVLALEADRVEVGLTVPLPSPLDETPRELGASSLPDRRAAWRAQIWEAVQALRTEQSERRREILRVAYADALTAERREALERHRAFANEVWEKTFDRVYARLVELADATERDLLLVAGYGYWPDPGPRLLDIAPRDGYQRRVLSETIAAWERLRQRRAEYERDVAALLNSAYAEIDGYLTVLLAQLEAGRELREREVQVSEPVSVAALVEADSRLLEEAPPLAPHTARSSAPPVIQVVTGRVLPPPIVREKGRSREALLQEVELFVRLNDWKRTDEVGQAEDKTDEFVAWRSGYREP